MHVMVELSLLILRKIDYTYTLPEQAMGWSLLGLIEEDKPTNFHVIVGLLPATLLSLEHINPLHACSRLCYVVSMCVFVLTALSQLQV